MNIRVGTICLLWSALALCSCDRFPDFVAMPEQRPRFDDPERWERMVRMTDVDARDHFVSDIFEPLAANWRWTGKRPMILLNAPPNIQRAYRMEFVVPEQSFRVTGPVEITFVVNGHVLDRKKYTAAGAYVFEKDVPPDWIATGEASLGAEIDKVVPAPNGSAYGFLMVAIGLKRR
ncbi:MAG TPA: hypothetical protein VHA14_09650 [Bryobacteraceae bacterium]|nr:hypothetical protein [Bryobacteraceae bacterium]